MCELNLNLLIYYSFTSVQNCHDYSNSLHIFPHIHVDNDTFRNRKTRLLDIHPYKYMDSYNTGQLHYIPNHIQARYIRNPYCTSKRRKSEYINKKAIIYLKIVVEWLSFKYISPCNASLLYIAYIDGKLPCQLFRRLLHLRTQPPQQGRISPSFPQTIYWTSFLRRYWFFHGLFCKLI